MPTITFDQMLAIYRGTKLIEDSMVGYLRIFFRSGRFVRCHQYRFKSVTSWRVHQVMSAPIKSRDAHVAGLLFLPFIIMNHN